MSPGLHLIHKPVGPTSFSVVQACASAIQASHTHATRRPPRACHGGALDPFAHGLLIILVEPATRLFDHLHDIPKTYHATVRWGIETDNGDPLGKPVATGDAGHLTPRQLNDALQPFLGWHDQLPPATSNKRVEGERAYTLAHRGQSVVLPPSKVYLHQARWTSHDLPRESLLTLTCRGGYYVRALVRDLGRALACPAHLGALHRVSIGPWQDPGPSNVSHVPAQELLSWCPTRQLADAELGALRDGKQIPIGSPLPPTWRLPDGFPAAKPTLRAFHHGRLLYLLQPGASSSDLEICADLTGRASLL